MVVNLRGCKGWVSVAGFPGNWANVRSIPPVKGSLQPPFKRWSCLLPRRPQRRPPPSLCPARQLVCLPHVMGCSSRTFLQVCKLPHLLNQWQLCHCFPTPSLDGNCKACMPVDTAQLGLFRGVSTVTPGFPHQVRTQGWVSTLQALSRIQPAASIY